MPDETAGRATLLLLGGIFAGAGLGVLVSWLLRRAGNQAASTWTGIATGLAVFAAAMTWVVSDLYGVVRQRSNHVLVQGTLLRFEAVRLSQSMRGRVQVGKAPVIEFTGADGRVHQTRGLGGSLQRREPGSTLNLLLDPQHPESASIADFQNQYAALWLFGSFCALAWLGVFFALCRAAAPPRVETWVPRPAAAHVSGKRARAAARLVEEHAEQAARSARAEQAARVAALPSAFDTWRSSQSGQHWRKTFARMALATGALSLLGIWVLADAVPLGRAVAIGLAGVTAALTCGAVAGLLKSGAPVGLTLLGHSIGVLAAGSFAGFMWALTAY